MNTVVKGASHPVAVQIQPELNVDKDCVDTLTSSPVLVDPKWQ